LDLVVTMRMGKHFTYFVLDIFPPFSLSMMRINETALPCRSCLPRTHLLSIVSILPGLSDWPGTILENVKKRLKKNSTSTPSVIRGGCAVP
jgi:hypothetical protein